MRVVALVVALVAALVIALVIALVVCRYREGVLVVVRFSLLPLVAMEVANST